MGKTAQRSAKPTGESKQSQVQFGFRTNVVDDVPTGIWFGRYKATPAVLESKGLEPGVQIWRRLFAR